MFNQDIKMENNNKNINRRLRINKILLLCCLITLNFSIPPPLPNYSLFDTVTSSIFSAYPPTNCAISNNGQYLVAGSSSGVQTWSLSTSNSKFSSQTPTSLTFTYSIGGVPQQIRFADSSNAYAIAISGSSDQVYIGTGGSIIFKQFNTGLSNQIKSVDFSTDFTKYGFGTNTNKVILVDNIGTAGASPSVTISNIEPSIVNSIRFATTLGGDKRYLTVSNDGFLKLFSISTNSVVATFTGFPFQATASGDISSDGSVIAVGYASGSISIFGPTLAQTQIINTPTINDLIDVELSNDGNLLLVSYNKNLAIYKKDFTQQFALINVINEYNLTSVPPVSNNILNVGITNDKSKIITCGSDGNIRVYLQCSVYYCNRCTTQANVCDSCYGSMVLNINNPPSTQCTCPPSTFIDPNTFQCIPCTTTSCKTCTLDQICQVCLPGFLLQESQCVLTCSFGYYQSISPSTGVNKCLKCNPKCRTCSAPSVCKSCPRGLFISPNGKCQPCNSKCQNQCVTAATNCRK